MLLLGVMTVSFLASCHEDDPNAPKDIELSDYITNNAWYLRQILQVPYNGNPLVDINGDGVVDRKDKGKSIEECDLDNQRLFKKDKTYEENSFNLACYGEEAHTIIDKGTWKIENNKLIITKTSGSEDVYRFETFGSKKAFILYKNFKLKNTTYTLSYQFYYEPRTK